EIARSDDDRTTVRPRRFDDLDCRVVRIDHDRRHGPGRQAAGREDLAERRPAIAAAVHRAAEVIIIPGAGDPVAADGADEDGRAGRAGTVGKVPQGLDAVPVRAVRGQDVDALGVFPQQRRGAPAAAVYDPAVEADGRVASAEAAAKQAGAGIDG